MRVLTYLLSFILTLLFSGTFGQLIEKPNVLFIMIDDLRPQLGCYGDSVVKTPHIDRLASGGTVFTRAYSQMALCSPSRSSLLTGRRPDETGTYNLTTHFRKRLPDIVTLPQLFRNNGWHSAGKYKIYHLIPSDPRSFGNMDDTLSWSEPLWLPARSVYGPRGEALKQQRLQALQAAGESMGYNNIPRGYAIEKPVMPDSMLADGETALQAVTSLRALKDQPFFLAVGFYKPHLPFIVPKKYWDLYDTSRIRLPSNRFLPKQAPAYASQRFADLALYEDFKHISNTTRLEEWQQKELLHGYLACISFVDAQVGLILDELDRLKLRDRTIVVIMSDHGYQVGEHDMWTTKHTNYETSTLTPLIISVPGQKSPGTSSSAIIELVDVYPTLADLCGLPAPDDLSGKSFASLLGKKDAAPWSKQYAFSQYPRQVKKISGMGRTIRTERYRLVEWNFPETGEKVFELYDHFNDPQENINIALLPENKSIVEHLLEQLASNWNRKDP